MGFFAGVLAWPFWTKLVVVGIGFTGGLVFMYVQCKVYLHLCRKWKAYNRIIVVQDAPEGAAAEQKKAMAAAAAAAAAQHAAAAAAAAAKDSPGGTAVSPTASGGGGGPLSQNNIPSEHSGTVAPSAASFPPVSR